MNLDTRTIGFALTEALEQRVGDHVEMALAPVAGSVTRVQVWLSDVNGDRGGVDKRCRVVVTLGHHRSAVAEATSEDLYVAIDEATRKVGRAAQRLLTRRQAHERKDAQRPGALVRP